MQQGTDGRDRASECPFCSTPVEDELAGNGVAFAMSGRSPLSPGHVLVVPRRHIPEWWSATSVEQQAVLDLVGALRNALLDDGRRAQMFPELARPAGFTIGFTSGSVMEQAVDHVHVHLIPHYTSDAGDSHGDVRGVIFGEGNHMGGPDIPGDVAPSPLELAVARRFGLHDAPVHPLGPVLADAMADEAILRADLLVSFVMVSGLETVQPDLDALLDRGGRVRLLTTDYLGITEKAALQRLHHRGVEYGDRFQVRVYRAGGRSFHPKAYMLWGEASSRAFIGSANLSGPGLRTGVEWSATITQESTLTAMAGAFDDLWSSENAEVLDDDLIADYVEAPRTIGQEVVAVAAPVQPVAPTPVQQEALDALTASRMTGFGAGLVVMATGLGKTWLAGFDTSRPNIRKVLFVAHREEILRQTREVFRRIRPDARVGMIQGDRFDADAEIVMASIQTLARRLDRLDPQLFDYIVIDEFHHAAAASYRRVIAHFVPKFLLGLTATPERADNAELLALCEDNLVYECGLTEGIERDLLVPFRYFGVPDTVDFRPLPWRNARFDLDALEHAVVARDRIDAAYAAWSKHRGSRTLGFCVSQRHADAMAQAFSDRGVAAVAVHAGPTSAPRHASIDALSRKELDVVFSVDMFNEGLDVPQIDTVLLLRPTTSPVVFLQQLGRGLRRSPGKATLTAVDFIGNHKSFLTPARLLAGLGHSETLSPTPLRDALADGLTLPAGCSVDYTLEAKKTLLDLLPKQRGARLLGFVQEWADERGQRPTAVQVYRGGVNPATAPDHWLQFLSDHGFLSTSEQRVALSHGQLLKHVSKMAITKSYKLVALRALIASGGLDRPTPVAELAAISLRLVRRDPRLLADFNNQAVADPMRVDVDAWQAYWRKWPLQHLTYDGYFTLNDTDFGLATPVPPQDADPLVELISELIDWRLARYLDSKQSAGRLVLKVSHTSGSPILRFDRNTMPTLPEGRGVKVDIGDRIVDMDFMKIAVNVARDSPDGRNILADVLRGWFGDDAGLNGTSHQVELFAGDVWRLQPLIAREDAEVSSPRI